MSKALLVKPDRDNQGGRLSFAPPTANGGAYLVVPTGAVAHTHDEYATDTDLATHVGASDPHTVYQKESEKDAASGYVGIAADGSVTLDDAASPKLNLSGTGSPGIEVRSTAGGTPYIDLSRSGADYDARLILLGNDYLDVVGAELRQGTGPYVVATSKDIADHVAALDPHAGYIDNTELGTQFQTHSTAPDPHTGYQKESEKGVASGYASLDANVRVPTAQLGSGTANATTYLRGDQSWGTPAGGGGTGTPGSGTTASAVGDSVNHGASTDYSRTDHKHSREAFGSVVAATSFGLVAANGSALTVPRSDHTHGSPSLAYGAVTAQTAYGQASTNGVSTSLSRADHAHGTPAAEGLSTHVAAADPHTGYQLESGKDVVSGYMGLDSTGYVNDPYRTAGGYVTAQNTVGGNTLRYAKIMSGSLGATNSGTTGLASLLMTDANGINTKRCTLRWSIGLHVAFGGQPSVLLELLDNSGFGPTDVMCVVTSVANPTTWQIHVALRSDWEQVWVTPLAVGATITSRLVSDGVTWHELETLSAALPAGTQYQATVAPTAASFGWLNVKDYGAKGDGVTNDYAAIQAAIDDAKAIGRGTVVFLPAGCYAIATMLTIYDSGPISLIGASRGGRTKPVAYGVGTQIKWIGAAGGNMLYIGESAPFGGPVIKTTSGVRVEHIEFDCNNLAPVAIHCRGTTDGVLYVSTKNASAGGTGTVWFDGANDPANPTTKGSGNYGWNIDVRLHGGNLNTGVRLMGAPNHWGNTCMCTVRVEGGYGATADGTGIGGSAHGLVMGDTDHNIIDWVWLFPEGWQAPDGPPQSDAYVVMFLAGDSPNTPAGNARKNLVRFLGGGDDNHYVAYFQGHATNRTPTENVIEWIDFQSSQAVWVGQNAERNRWYGDASHWYGELDTFSIAGTSIANYNPTDDSGNNINFRGAVFRVTSDASTTIHGWIPASPGAMRWVYNGNGEASGRNITLKHKSTNASTTAANKFICPNNADTVLNPGEMISMWYDKTVSRWIVFGKS